MALKEKGRPAGGDPIPNYVLPDNAEFIAQPFELQARRLSQLYALSIETAATLAPFVFAVVPR
jgi:hypothetical protein